ncbi:cell death regulator Aven isoform X2 [Pseudophryne corroboree]|uniref:cell death regulator Aven isoform X2 n=1 Tax=Pseudophryne corroboree TaxID=495146 RepID=UPI0030816EF2
MERGRGRYRRGGGGGRRPHRSRGSGGDREFVHRGHRGGARDRTGPRENEEQAVDVVDPGEEKEDQSSGFSRRKILSNWDRYKAAEKEKENEVLQRGTDYSVLLSSAGDAFTQFRFADEREWAAEKLSTTQDSSVYLDSQSLVKALQELPLHLRLNIEADLVQEELPQELPPFMLKGNPNMAPTFTAQIITGSTVASDQAAASLPEPQTPQNPSLPALDEELDFLLSLDAPIREERAASPGVTKQHDEQVTCEEHDHAGSDALEAHKAVTSEDLEDWLDSMIG